MREILFRGKRRDNGEWIEGCYLDRNNIGIFYDDTEEEDCKVHIFSVDSNTVGQYTGLLDKNDKKIFEGDVVQLCCGIYGTYEMYIFDIRNGFKPIEEEKIIEVEIIANVYDNPELLEVK